MVEDVQEEEMRGQCPCWNGEMEREESWARLERCQGEGCVCGKGNVSLETEGGNEGKRGEISFF